MTMPGPYQPHPYQPQPPKPPKPAWWTRPWVVAPVAAFIGLTFGVMTSPPPSDAQPEPTATVTVTTTASPEPAPTVTTTATVTATPKPTEPAPSPTEAAETPAADDLGPRVLAAIDDGMPGGRNDWAKPITDIETISSDTVRVHYQERLTDDEAQQVGRMVRTFTRLAVPELATVVIRDTSGIDRNVF